MIDGTGGAETVLPQRARIAACFGGGGAFGIGFNLGVAHALESAGIPVSSGPMLGTSAGAWTAAALAVGRGLDEMLATWRQPRSEQKVRVIAYTRSLFGQARDARVSVATVRLPVMYPSILSGSRYDLADLVAASSSPPRAAHPHRIGAAHYIDAGIVTTTSAHRAARADLLVVVAPMAGPVTGRFGAIADRIVHLEMMRWRMHGGHVLYIRPNRAVGALAGTKPTDVLDDVRAEPAYRGGYELGARCADRFAARHSDLFERCAA
jgi:predicted acylesterase/phospholipase RssA